MRKRNSITHEEIDDVLSYDGKTGNFIWKKSPTRRIPKGSIAGALDKDGYRIIKIKNIGYRAHRLAWFIVNGHWPTNQIDHVNGVRDDNRIENLREATNSQNNQNRKCRKDSRTGFIGVQTSIRNKKYIASITINGKYIYLGSFNTPEEAHVEYLNAKRMNHSFSPELR